MPSRLLLTQMRRPLPECCRRSEEWMLHGLVQKAGSIDFPLLAASSQNLECQRDGYRWAVAAAGSDSINATAPCLTCSVWVVRVWAAQMMRQRRLGVCSLQCLRARPGLLCSGTD